MENIQKATQKVGETRQLLQDLINEKPSLLDPEVIIVSQKLDAVLNEYDNILKKADK